MSSCNQRKVHSNHFNLSAGLAPEFLAAECHKFTLTVADLTPEGFHILRCASRVCMVSDYNTSLRYLKIEPALLYLTSLKNVDTHPEPLTSDSCDVLLYAMLRNNLTLGASDAWGQGGRAPPIRLYFTLKKIIPKILVLLCLVPQIQISGYATTMRQHRTPVWLPSWTLNVLI